MVYQSEPTLRFLRTEVMELKDDVTSQSKSLCLCFMYLYYLCFPCLYRDMWYYVFGIENDFHG